MVPVETQIPNPEQLDFMHIKIKVGHHNITGDLSADLQIPDDPELLAQEISKWPSLFFYWSSVAEVAKRELEKLKGSYEVWFAEKYIECKSLLTEEFGKSGITETMVKGKLFLLYGEEYNQWQEELSKAEYRRSILSVAASSFKEKGQAMTMILSWRKAQLHAE